MFSLTQQEMLRVLTRSEKPLTVAEWAAQCKVSPQTIRNHLNVLERSGQIQVARMRTGTKGFSYEPTSIGAGKSIAIRLNGDVKSLREIVKDVSEGARPSGLQRQLVSTIVTLYQLSLEQLDDENPVPVPYRILKDEQAKLINLVKLLQSTIESIEDLLSVEDLWDPAKLPKALIMNDTNISFDELISMLDRINQS
jgi:DNA-binding transcriptional ArsR family regulator